MTSTSTRQAVAYSYIRFSSPQQARGDSLRRQTAASQSWCARNRVRLDDTLMLRDLGTSAFSGKHRSDQKSALAAFLALVRTGKIARGSYLILESLDRLTREQTKKGLMLVLGLIEAGIRIVQLSPIENIYDESADERDLMMMIAELARGHSESKVKSQRIGEAWGKKKAAARDGKNLTKHLPAWIRLEGGKRVLIPERAEAVRTIFDLAANGYGTAAIVGKLKADGVKPIGRGKHWARSYIAKILNDRRAVGEFQPAFKPKDKPRKKDGAPIDDYFPPVVTEQQYHLARAGALDRKRRGRKKGSGRPASIARGTENLFAGLVTHARDGDSYYAAQRTENREGRGNSRQWVLINTASAEGRAKCISFPLVPFEYAMLEVLDLFDAKQLIENDDQGVEIATLTAELEAVEKIKSDLAADMDKNGEVAEGLRMIREKEARKAELQQELDAAKARGATPVAEAWADIANWRDIIDKAEDKDDMRRRMRNRLRQVIGSIHLLVVPRGRIRLAAVQLSYQGFRDHPETYLIYYRGSVANAETRTEPELRVLTPRRRAEYDLRKTTDVAKAEKGLAALSLDELHTEFRNPDTGWWPVKLPEIA